ncbi:N-acetyltransferase [Longispora fulva]|uniref:Aminoglycoside 6'-N-acetyltransferase n=1 Tax=Longispora fulva TaxID=619741 RepID=A0A8J7KG08_9ACTN|nr:GNAT family N-acetyltransferase [Longispora fulva]MBG6136830.1 aminoglycoside 6'-N-acetyltransferase [Longispora fulva]GIG60000.1 N-acetyltransferase [Longispora fulva]
MHLDTDRLVLRRFRPADAPALAAYRSDPAIARYQSWTTPLTPADAADLVRRFAAGDPGAPGWFQWAVELRSEGVLIGDLGCRLDDNLMQADLGFTLAADRHGHGYATEAVRGLLAHLFGRGLRRVSAECDARNGASARLLERVGFRREGLRPAYTFIKGEWTDDLLFGLLAEHWPPA